MPAFDADFLQFVLIGFLAQLVDGSLGMAYGTLCTSVLLFLGVPPVTASASTHTAQFFTTGISALSHSALKNVNWKLCLILMSGGIIGGLIGAIFLTKTSGDFIKPWIAAYLLILGLHIIYRYWKRLRQKPRRKIQNPFLASILGFFGGLLDAIGGGGWGPVVTSNLIARDLEPRYVIGSVNTAEFFVKTSIAACFIVLTDFDFGTVVFGLLTGGILAAPFGAYILRLIKADYLLLLVGFLITSLSLFQIYGLLLK